jgi:hypothetical protein
MAGVRADVLASRIYQDAIMSDPYTPANTAEWALDVAAIFMRRLALRDPETCEPKHAGLPVDDEPPSPADVHLRALSGTRGRMAP